MENIKAKMRERLSSERKFRTAKEALEYAVIKQRTEGEDVLVFKTLEGSYLAVHYINSEIAIQLGYEVVFGYNNVLYASQSNENYIDLLQQLNDMEG